MTKFVLTFQAYIFVIIQANLIDIPELFNGVLHQLPLFLTGPCKYRRRSAFERRMENPSVKKYERKVGEDEIIDDDETCVNEFLRAR